jgi:predicted nucleotidyltransferase component of viral defense system
MSKNIAASVRQRLLNRARNDKRPFNELLQYYAMERFLYRLSRSAHSQHFILKGALMLRVWRAPELRPTMDIDLLGRTSNEEIDLVARFREILAVEVEPDGLVFDPASLQSEHITEDADYQGIRMRFRGALDSARVAMQVDIGFGDIVYPEPESSELPTLLAFPAPKLLCYSRESAIAEKFEAMVKHGRLNSRMKDFYDVWLLSRQFDFDGEKLAEAIRLTFGQRKAEIPAKASAFEQDFIDAKQVQWAAFRKRLQQEHVPEFFGEVVSAIEDFITPLTIRLVQNLPVSMHWSAPGSWSRQE